jgi:hypothetical protein
MKILWHASLSLKIMKKILILLSLLFSFSCREKVKTDIAIPSLDMMTVTAVDFDDWVEDVECVLLENNPAGYLRVCRKIIEYDSRYYLYSFDDFCVSIFRQSGEFVRTIKNQKRGITLMPCDIFINEEKKQLRIIEEQKFLYKYTLDGAFVEEQELPFMAVKMAQTGKDRYLFYDGGFDRESPCYLRAVTGDGFSDARLFIPKYFRNYRAYPLSLFASDRQSTFVFLPHNDTLYICSAEQKVMPLFRLDFRGTFLTHDEMPEDGFSMEEGAGVINENLKYTSVQGFHYVNGLLFMKLTGRDHSFRALDLENMRVYGFETLTDGLRFAPEGSTENCLLLSLSSEEVLKHYAGDPEKETKYPAVKALLKQLETQHGRVIFKIKLKQKEKIT